MSRHGVHLTEGEFCDGCALRHIGVHFVNASVEKEYKTIVESAHSMLQSFNLPKLLWEETCNKAVCLLTLTEPSDDGNKTPVQIWTGKTVRDLKHLKVFGTQAKTTKSECQNERCTSISQHVRFKLKKTLTVKDISSTEEDNDVFFKVHDEKTICSESEYENENTNRHDERSLTTEPEDEN
ncbi:hypothetical protein ILUMI_20879 [Ignelater luminosus]|uniref:Uncharacterized protein n=1 Tax=Ignelater luminosus TaxID=2038154 RepID=A0A8K0CGM8_IGNLU|nr:hypothetical protein ILUMI_20879 [Ignelater luminosus]